MNPATPSPRHTRRGLYSWKDNQLAADQYDLADAAHTLRNLYRELAAAKQHAVIREARVTRPAPGPQAPTPTHLLSLEVDLTTRLREMTSECMLHLNATAQAWPEPTSLCTWIRHNAGPISQLDVAEALLDELTDQAKEIKHKIDNLPGTEPTEQDIKTARIQRHLANKYLPRT